MTKKQKKSLLLIIISAVLFAACKIIPFDSFGANGRYIELACYLIPFLVAGTDIVIKAVRNIFSGQMMDENFLMTVATVGAFLIGEAGEAVTVVILYRVGVLFESFATEKSRKSIEDLMNICPDYANVLRNGEICQVEPLEVGIGEEIIVKPGEKVPLDGTVIEGESTLDTAALTGESSPVNIVAGDKAVSGAINGSGLLKIKVESEYENSTVGRILELIEDSTVKKAKTENYITRFAGIYTPVVVIGAVLVAILPPLFGLGAFKEWIERALTFLVISCPCALVISVPLAFFGAMGTASKKGILIKGASYLENLDKIKTCLFDKTGTLTKGSFKVTAIHPEKVTEAELLRIAAAAESFSNHPISVSLVSAYGRVPDLKAENVMELPGAGVRAQIEGKTVLVGNEKLMKLEKIAYHECHRHLPGTTVHIAMDKEYMGHIIISDEIKEDAFSVIKALKQSGVNTVMLTGDREDTAKTVAEQLGIDEYKAGLLPDGKVDYAEKIISSKQKNEVIAFVGDGINDAPVLMRADVGISMGSMGSDAAIEAADIVIMDDCIGKIATAKKISKKAMRIVKENIAMFIIIKSAFLILSAVGSSPMWLATFADVGVLIISVLNSARTMTFGRQSRQNPNTPKTA